MNHKTLIILAKAPIRGRVKTRLVPPLTHEQSLALHQAFIKDTLERVSRLGGIKLCLGYYPRGYKHKFNGLLPPGTELFCQRGKDLGERMKNALQRYLMHAEQVVVIGADSPCLPTSYIQDAFGQLDSHQLVIGPALDGGYYLIGGRVTAPEAFSHIPWGTERVFELTRARLTRSGYKYAVLPAWFDIDRPEDLHYLKRYLARTPRRLPATRRVIANCLPID
jgi:hypothetical protein